MAELKNTPLREFHVEMGARMVPRSGWNLPLNFSEGAADEHELCRSKAVLFDLCADGRYRIAFAEAAAKLGKLFSKGIEDLVPGHYRREWILDKEGNAAALCHISCMAGDDFFLTVPLECRSKAEKIILSAVPDMADLSEYLGCIGLSGPESGHVLTLCGLAEDELPRTGETKIVELDGLRAIISFTDETGEEGYEINFNAECADQLWDLFLDTGIPWPAGIAARESLRIEHGVTGPAEIVVPCLVSQLVTHVGQVIFEGRRAPFAGVKLFDAQGKEVGTVSSGSFCPTLKSAAALVYFPDGKPGSGTILHGDANGVEITGTLR